MRWLKEHWFYLPVYLSIYLHVSSCICPFVYLSFCPLSIGLLICLWYGCLVAWLSIYLFICLFICLFLYLSDCLPVYLSASCLSCALVYLSVYSLPFYFFRCSICLFTSFFIYLSLYFPASLSVLLFVHLCVSVPRWISLRRALIESSGHGAITVIIKAAITDPIPSVDHLFMTLLNLFHHVGGTRTIPIQ